MNYKHLVKKIDLNKERLKEELEREEINKFKIKKLKESIKLKKKIGRIRKKQIWKKK